MKMMLVAVAECTGEQGESSKGRQLPQPCRQDDCDGAPNMTATGELQQVNGQTTAIHSHNGILLGYKKEWTNGAHNCTDES